VVPVKLLIDKKDRKYLVEGKELHTGLGVVNIEEAEIGRVVKSHLGHEFSVLRPRLIDLYEKLPRAGSVFLKKDIGFVLAYTGVGTGDVVVDAGTGSGSVAMFLANVVRPAGKVYTYEIREKFADIARKNIERAGLSDFIEIKMKDITEGIDERDVDLVTLDLPDPWNAISHAYKALRHGGFVVSYSPYIEQVKKTADALEEEAFRAIRTFEVFEREMEISKKGARPKTRMLGHTAYLTFARKY
jgi:tRNA (adenine57-N1/adenine58-N1)-methyltransferase